MCKIKLALVGALLLGALQTSAAYAGKNDWARLIPEERKSIDYIDFKDRSGRFTKIRLVAIRQRVFIASLSVKFENGKVANYKIEQEIGKGDRTRPIDLPGNARAIDSVQITYRQSARSDGFASVEGLSARSKDWSRIDNEDRKSVDFLDIKKKSGRFTKVRLVAVGDSIFVSDLSVKFENGKVANIKVEREIRKGDTSRPFDLPGDARAIDAVQIGYRQRAKRDGFANVDGLIADEPGGFKVLDTVGLDTKDDMVRIRLDGNDRAVGSIRLRAWVEDVVLRKAEIVFENGDRQEVKIRDRLEPGQATPPIDLLGYRRKIQRVDLTLKPQRGRSEYARIDLLGKAAPAGHYERGRDNGKRGRDLRDRDRGRDHDRRGGLGRDWELLGTRKAAIFSKDSDVFPIGKSKGRFTTIRVRALEQDVQMYGMTIIYGNGNREDVGIYGTLREGELSQPFDLKGKRRFIDKIEFKYRTKLNLKGQGEVELWGKSAG